MGLPLNLPVYLIGDLRARGQVYTGSDDSITDAITNLIVGCIRYLIGNFQPNATLGHHRQVCFAV